jgi:hypothetical protein
MPGDSAQRFAPANSQQNLLTFRDRQAAWPWFPAQWFGVSVSTLAHHEADHRSRAANLPADIDQTPATCPQPERQLLLLRAQVAMPSLHPVPSRDRLSRLFHRTRCADRLNPPSLIGSPQLTHLAFKLGDALLLRTRYAWPFAAVDLGLFDPIAQ